MSHRNEKSSGALARHVCLQRCDKLGELLVSYMPLAYFLLKAALDAHPARASELLHVAFLTVAAERWLTWVKPE